MAGNHRRLAVAFPVSIAPKQGCALVAFQIAGANAHRPHPDNHLWDNGATAAGELLITYDPTPATWMWAWDNDIREKANFATSVGFVFKRQHTTADAALFIAENGALYAFPGGTPARFIDCRARSRISCRP